VSVAGSRQLAVIGVSQTPVERKTSRSITELAIAAILDAVKDAGLTMRDIDGYVGCPDAPNPTAAHADGFDEISARHMVAALGIREPAWFQDVEGMATGMIVAAAHALAAGTCTYIVGVRALYNPVDRTYSASDVARAAGPQQFKLPYGLGAAGGRFALWLQRYMHDYGATREDLYEIARAARENAQRNPLAVWHNAPSLKKDDYLAARWIYEPMCLYDADMPVSGAVAFVMTTADRAASVAHSAYLTSLAVNDAARLLNAANVSVSDIQVAQLYDGFSLMVWDWLERIGFCQRGEGYRFLTSPPESTPRVAINTFGGALGEGRLHGAGHVREAVLQAMGRAGTRQIANVEHSLVQVGVPERSWLLLFGPRPMGRE
jgi:acetyl-CoA acetyltransferase